MKKTLKKALSFVLALTMVFSSLIMMNPVSAKEAATYTIYPTPHEMVYNDGEFTISDDVNVVYGNAIDNYTKVHAVDVLDILNKTVTVSDAIVVNKTNLIVGTYGSDDYADKYFKENALINDESLFEKFDAYILSIKDGVIAVLGKDTDAAFHGVTSLKHIFNQVKDNTVLNLTLNDYADVKGRGFIEGYYGNPWSNEDRADLMTFGGDYKLNQYVYAPKDDPKHNADWRELYTDEELEGIHKAAEAGNKAKCYYVYALHPFMNKPIRFNTDENYENDLNIIKTKFEQLMDAGVKQFAILADDANTPTGGANSYIRLMKDLTDWLIAKKADVPGLKHDMIFCPSNYTGYGDSAQLQGLKGLPESVSIIETGGGVWGCVGPEFNDRFYNNMGRPAFMWINWPCSDNTKDGLIMGGAERVLKPNTRPETVAGIILNPMQQSEASKEGIFTNADYAWNIWEDASQYDKVWHDSFNFMDHGTIEDTPASIGLREISKHMMNSQQLHNEESVEIKDRMSQFITDLNAGVDINALADELIAEFTLLQESARTYKANPGNERTRNQIIYWLDCWEDTTTAVINYLNAAKVLQADREGAEIWEYFSKGQAAFESSRTHGFHYVNHTEYAKVGRKYIYPFMLNLDTILAAKVAPIVNPGQQVVSVITNRSDAPTSDAKSIIDGNDSTYAQWKSPNSSAAGEYVGVTFTNSIELNEVKFLMSDSATNNKNTFKTAKLQYTVDGQEWLDIEGSEAGNKALEISATGLDVRVKGIRVVCSEETPDIWLAVREVYVNGETISKPAGEHYNATVFKINGYGYYQSYTADKLIDDDDNTFAWFSTSNGSADVGDYVGLDLGAVKKIGKVRFIMGHDGNDYWNKYDLEYSEDGTNYTKYASYTQNVDKKVIEEDFEGIKARYVRVRNTASKGVWLKMSAFSIDPASETSAYTNSDALKDVATIIEPDVASITPRGDITLNPNEYLGIALPRIRDIATIDLQLVNGDALILEASKNGVDWADVNLSDLPDARYVRLTNKTAAPVTFEIQKFEIKSNEISAPFLLDSDMGINGSWGVVEDCRNNGLAFDGNVDTITEFADFPQKGQYIIYDLGQERTINTIAMYCQDSAVNYIRDAEILISADLENWTKVATIGDGVENLSDSNITCINSDAGYKASSTYPNKVYVDGTVDNVQARYLKILMTASNNNRAVLFNEIVINDGEYIPVSNDPTFDSSAIEVQGMVPQNMFDGNLSTSYRPNTKEAGYITYTLSDNLDVKKINIIQKGMASNAKVLALVDGETGREWVEVGTLDKSLNEIYLPFWSNIYELKLEWEAYNIPTISEIIMLNNPDFLPNREALQAYVDGLDIVESDYTAESYAVFAEALAAANSALKDNNSSQKGLDNALVELQNAVNNLVALEKPKTDKTALQIAVEMAQEADLTNVIPAVKAEFEAALTNAQTILVDEYATQEEVNNAFDRLANVMHMLDFFKGDKAALQKFFDKVTGLDKDAYLPNTWDDFVAAYNNAKAVLDDVNAMQEEVNETYNSLVRAFLELRLKPNKDALKDLINQAESLNEPALANAIAKAKAVYDNANATQIEVDNAVKTLNTAIEGLTKSNENVNSGDKAPTGSIKTGDNNIAVAMMSMAALSLAGLYISRKKED